MSNFLFSESPFSNVHCLKLLKVKSIELEKVVVFVAKDLGQHLDGQVFGWRIFLRWLEDSKVDFGLLY